MSKKCTSEVIRNGMVGILVLVVVLSLIILN